MNKNDLLKAHLLMIVKHHRETCEGATCNISLSLMKELGEQAGLTFTDEESQLFW